MLSEGEVTAGDEGGAGARVSKCLFRGLLKGTCGTQHGELTAIDVPSFL